MSICFLCERSRAQEICGYKSACFAGKAGSRQRVWYAVVLHLNWAKKRGIIPIVKEGHGPGSITYLDRIAVESVAVVYHLAKEQGHQPIKFLEEILAER